ncbi:MAG: TniB family NTP-binding protein [Brevibacterium sp.]|nr:TniB family NTP-binding protein [Brevibacterium sp.]MDN5908203.1 TniB family NTP-binding protein [Brevibacterium sp.]MDN6190325.1 TniB family NTP-binding protein [Brevibacterium sp.]MDN6603446.1 TniB family NTP-binding protein [Brevibacterium sp.]
MTAPFTAGKSTTVKAVARELYRDWMADFGDERPRWNPPGHADVEADRIPIIYVNLQSDTSSKDLYAQILTFMGHGASWTRSQLAINTSKAFSIHGVKLVILDDAHMLRTHLKQGQATLDAIKAIATELGEVGGMMILVGAWTADSDLLDDQQIRGRLSLHQLDVYSIGSNQERALWQRLLKAWEDKIERFLPGMETGDLSQSAARYLYERTQGYVGDLAKCLSQATSRAIREGRDTIVNDDLKMVRLSARAHDHELGSGTTGRHRPRKTKRNVG